MSHGGNSRFLNLVLFVEVVAGFRYKLRFDVMKTTCAKEEHKELSELCVPDEHNKVNI